MKKIHDTAVFSVIFPANRAYFEDFIDSLKSQTLQEFDLVLINDGLDEVPAGFYDFNTLIFSGTNSIAGSREVGINKLIELQYSKIIFSDSDDGLKSNRVEVCHELLDNYDCIANDLDLMDDQGKLIHEGFWKQRLNDLQSVGPDFLLDQNIYGLGNSAVRGDFLQNLVIPQELKVVDWFLFIHWIQEGSKAVFTSRTSTLYRQHAANIAAAGQVTEKSVLRALDVKEQLYNLLSHKSEDFRIRYQKVQKLRSDWEDPVQFEKYLSEVKDSFFCPFWWEEVQFDI